MKIYIVDCATEMPHFYFSASYADAKKYLRWLQSQEELYLGNEKSNDDQYITCAEFKPTLKDIVRMLNRYAYSHHN